MEITVNQEPGCEISIGPGWNPQEGFAPMNTWRLGTLMSRPDAVNEAQRIANATNKYTLVCCDPQDVGRPNSDIYFPVSLAEFHSGTGLYLCAGVAPTKRDETR